MFHPRKPSQCRRQQVCPCGCPSPSLWAVVGCRVPAELSRPAWLPVMHSRQCKKTCRMRCLPSPCRSHLTPPTSLPTPSFYPCPARCRRCHHCPACGAAGWLPPRVCARLQLAPIPATAGHGVFRRCLYPVGARGGWGGGSSGRRGGSPGSGTPTGGQRTQGTRCTPLRPAHPIGRPIRVVTGQGCEQSCHECARREVLVSGR